MRIAIVGGLEREESEIERRVGAFGHSVEFHRGRVGGRHAGELEAIVQRADLAIVVTSVNSHGAMYIAKRSATRWGRRMIITRTGSPSRISALLQSLDTPGDAPSPQAIGA